MGGLGARKGLKFGVIAGNHNSPRRLAEFAKASEDAGFEHFLLSDHYFVDEYPDLLDSWAVIGYLSGLTSTIRLGTCVSPLTFRPPLQFAKIVTSLDQVSNGRIIVGVGVGWEQSEFEMFSQWHPNKERYAQFREALRLLKMAWTEKRVSFSGRFYRVREAIVEPKPVQKPYPPLLFGGSGTRLLRLAGKEGDGWTPTGPRSGETVKTPEDYRRLVQVIKGSLEEAGRTRDKFDFGCRFGPFEDPRDHLREIEEFSTAGLNCYQLGVNVNKHLEKILKAFGDSVIESH